MLNLLGEYDCKVDAKGRMMLPAKLRKQLEDVVHHGLVVNRDLFSKCLVIYPKPEWDKVNAEMSLLSRYNKNHQLFQRKFMNGATPVELDGTGRINIPKSLLDYAEIDPKKDNALKITGLGEKMELWSKANHDKEVIDADDDFDFTTLADQVQKDITEAQRNKNDK